MGVRILRRLQAANDAEGIADHIAKDNVEAAVGFLENAEATLKKLSEFPGGGSRFESDHPDLANVRYRRVKGFPKHLIFYVEHAEAIECPANSSRRARPGNRVEENLTAADSVSNYDLSQ